MMPVDSSDPVNTLDINNLPPSQQDRVIRFASELAKSLHQIQLAAETRQKNENAQMNSQQIPEKTKNHARK